MCVSLSLALLLSFSVSQLKVWKTITKNLADPVKSQDEKYRQLKLDNEKIQQKLVPCNPHALDFLQALGFTRSSSSSTVLTCATVPSLLVTQGALEEISQALTKLEGGVNNNNNSSSSNNKRTLQHQSSSTVSTSSTFSTTSSSTEKLSEKQKARRLLEEKERAEKEEARRRRKATAALIQQDKYVRKHDENWVSQPSAACVKTGSAISTFRDRHGEN